MGTHGVVDEVLQIIRGPCRLRCGSGFPGKQIEQTTRRRGYGSRFLAEQITCCFRKCLGVAEPRAGLPKFLKCRITAVDVVRVKMIQTADPEPSGRKIDSYVQFGKDL